MSNKKQTMIMGALIGSAGIFITKLIGLIYVIPFNALVGDENLVYYAFAYRVYGYLLNVTMAGFPFAIASLVAKYMVKEEYDTVIAIRKISFYVMGIFGFVCMMIVMVFAHPIARFIMTDSDSVESILITKQVLQIISLSLFIVPILGVYRGFYQGLKELSLYSFSQVLEQLVRVVFLLTAGYIAVYLFRQDRIAGIYFAVLSTSLSALVATVYLKINDHKLFSSLKNQALHVVSSDKVRTTLRELVVLAMPFMVVSILGNSYYMIDLLIFKRAMAWYGETAKVSSLIYGIINVNVDKLTSIPMVIAPGFSLAIIPYITSSYIKNDMKTVTRNVTDCISTALFLVLPLSLVLLSLGAPIYSMYGGDNVALGGQILSWYSLDGMTSALAPVITALMMALNLRYSNIKNVLLGVLVKLITVVPLMLLFGYVGALLSSVIGTITSIGLNLYSIQYVVPINYRKLLQVTSKIFLCLCMTQLVFLACSFVGLRVVDQNRVVGFLELALIGTLGGITYFASAFYMRLPQLLFHKSTAELKHMFLHKFGGKS